MAARAADRSPAASGERRTALCGVLAEVYDADDIEWLRPTCAICWDRARELRDKP